MEKPRDILTSRNPGDTEQHPGDRLVMELRRLGVRYLSIGSLPHEDTPLPPEALVVGLATSDEARLRAALVPPFIWRPEYASAARIAAQHLTGRARVTLICNYSAVSLQILLSQRLNELGYCEESLPDLFASELHLRDIDDPNTRLTTIAECHAQLPEGTQERQVFIGRYGAIDVYVFDPYVIALTKLERSFELDREDIVLLVERGLVNLDLLSEMVTNTLTQAAAYQIDPAAMLRHLAIVRKRTIGA